MGVRMRARPLLLVIAALLGGCGIQSTVIRSQALTYDDVIEDTTDKLLLLNILRAKDKAPLHFDEIPSIHESIQATAGLQASWPFGPRLANSNTGPRNMVQPTLGVQIAPSFEVDHLDTKDFVTGIASPIDPKFVKYWLDRGLDRRIILLLFFSAADITRTKVGAVFDGTGSVTTGSNVLTITSVTSGALHVGDVLEGSGIPRGTTIASYTTGAGTTGTYKMSVPATGNFPGEAVTVSTSITIRITNSPREALDTLDQQRQIKTQGPVAPAQQCDVLSDFQRYLRLINELEPLAPRYFRERHLLVKGLKLENTDAPQKGRFTEQSSRSGDGSPDDAGDKPRKSDWETIGSLDPDKYYWTRNDDETFDIYSISSEATTELCPISTEQKAAGSDDCIRIQIGTMPADLGGVTQLPLPSPRVEKRNTPSAYCEALGGVLGRPMQAAAPARIKSDIRLEIRSVGEMIQFLGDLLEYQDQLPQALSGMPADAFTLNAPFTLGYCPDHPTDKACGDIFFNLPSDTCNSRFAVNYRGRVYAVPNYNAAAEASCRASAAAKDHTLEVLSVVHQMIDLQKSADDIRETPYVQVLP